MSDAIVDVVDMLRLFPNVPYQLVRADGTLGPVQQSRKPESDELAQRIAAATDRDLHTMDAWITALREDVAYNDTLMHQLMALAMDGDDMQFGVRLAQAIRKQVIASATETARYEYEEEHDTGEAA